MTSVCFDRPVRAFVPPLYSPAGSAAPTAVDRLTNGASQAPAHASDNRSVSMETSAEQNSRTVRGSKRKSSSLAAHDAIEVITGALQEEYGQLRAAAKHIARDADRTEKAVRNWLEKKNLPDAL